MKEDLHRFHQLPPLFHSDEKDGPFVRCGDCGGDLLEMENGYFIQKAFAARETIMEVAVCSDCHSRLQRSYSTESRTRIWDFYLDRADLPGRLKKFQALPVGQPDFWLNRCVTCPALRPHTAEYILAGQCIGDYLIYGETPMMMCLRCMEEIIGLFSAESLEIYDRWMERVAPPVPGYSSERPRVRILI